MANNSILWFPFETSTYSLAHFSPVQILFMDLKNWKEHQEKKLPGKTLKLVSLIKITMQVLACFQWPKNCDDMKKVKVCASVSLCLKKLSGFSNVLIKEIPIFYPML